MCWTMSGVKESAVKHSLPACVMGKMTAQRECVCAQAYQDGPHLLSGTDSPNTIPLGGKYTAKVAETGASKSMRHLFTPRTQKRPPRPHSPSLAREATRQLLPRCKHLRRALTACSCSAPQVKDLAWSAQALGFGRCWW